jgi:ABC-type transporter Mla subunit MlaD
MFLLQSPTLPQQIVRAFLNESLPDTIIAIQLISFLIWFVFFVVVWARQSRAKGQIEDLRTDRFDVQSLRRQGVRDILIEHLEAIRNSSRTSDLFDISLLSRNTFDRLNIGSTALRSFLSLFLILGLLGTLCGLAISLSQFSVALDTSRELTSDAFKAGLRSLLDKLGVAFVPSMVGVSITILGVFLYTLFSRITSGPLANLIEQKTVAEWVPALAVTASQREIETLSELEALVKQNVDLANENKDAVTGFKNIADSLTTEAGDLSTNVRTASETLKVLSESSQNLSQFSVNFVESTKHLTSFQEELKSIYLQIEQVSSSFATSVSTLLDETRANHRSLGQEMLNNHEAIREVFERLKVYEEGYVSKRQEIDEKLGTLLVTASDTYRKIGVQNDAMANALADRVGQPLQTAMTGGLQGIADSVSERFQVLVSRLEGINGEYESFLSRIGSIKTSIDSINSPLEEAATDIRGVATGFDKRTNTILGEIRQEFQGHSMTTQSQLDKLKDLDSHIADLNASVLGLGSKIDAFNSAANQLKVAFARTPTGTTTSNGERAAPNGKDGWSIGNWFRRR